jgi:type IV pilus assembly protein PilM
MLGFVRNWFSPKAAPIGIDLGTDTLRLAQCIHDGRDWQLHAAACTDIPASVRTSTQTLNDYLSQTLRALVAEGNFAGRDCVISVPSTSVYLQHLRLPRLDDAELKKALPWEVKDKLPIDSAHAVLRHVIAGDVQVNNEPRQEVIVMATPKSAVSQMLYIAGRARLNVQAVNVEARAIVDCFSHVYRRKIDADLTVAYIDLGCLSTRVTIARAGQIMFARSIAIGGDTFSHAVAKAMQTSFEQAKLLRIALASAPLQRPALKAVDASLTTSPTDDSNSFALLGLSSERRQQVEAVDVIPSSAPADIADQSAAVEAAVQPLVQQLCEELNLCR